MSDASQRTGGVTGDPSVKKPRAIVHKRILDVARDKPDAPIATLAEEVSGASPDLVERVLEEYGDPADGSGPGPDEANGTDQSADTDAGDEETGSGHSAGTNDAADHEEAEDPSGTTPGSGREKLTLLNDGSTPAAGSENGAGPDREADDRDTESDGDVHEAASGDGEAPVPDPGELDEKQLAVLRAVRERPTATQKELAASLGVSRATVSKRVNRIEGFDWQDRAAFVERLFRDGDPTDGHRGPDPVPTRPDLETASAAAGTTAGGATDSTGCRRPGRDLEAAVDELADRVAALNERVDDVTASASGDAGALVDDPELAHKVVHACFESDRISREEELRLLRTLLDE